MVGVFGMFAGNMPVTLAELAKYVFRSRAGGYGALSSIVAGGPLLGSIDQHLGPQVGLFITGAVPGVVIASVGVRLALLRRPASAAAPLISTWRARARAPQRSAPDYRRTNGDPRAVGGFNARPSGTAAGVRRRGDQGTCPDRHRPVCRRSHAASPGRAQASTLFAGSTRSAARAPETSG
jgi:hypothetical protein